MFVKRVVLLVLTICSEFTRKNSTEAKTFEKTFYSNGSHACALDEPYQILFLDELISLNEELDSCAAPGALCALQCAQHINCSSYNYKAKLRSCELFDHQPIHCVMVDGCSLAQVIGQESCQNDKIVTVGSAANSEFSSKILDINSAESSTPEFPLSSDTISHGSTAVTESTIRKDMTSASLMMTTDHLADDLTQNTTLSSTTSTSVSISYTRPTASTGSVKIDRMSTPASQTATKTVAVSKLTSLTFTKTVALSIMTTSTSAKAVPTTTMTTKSSTKTGAIPTTVITSSNKPTTTGIVRITSATTTAIAASTIPLTAVNVPPTISLTVADPCDKVLGPISYTMQINRGKGLDQAYSAYRNGFSDANGGYWMGLEPLYQMTNNGAKWKICCLAQETSGSAHYVTYSTFIIDSESSGYTYFVSGMTGSPIDPMSSNNRKYKFTAKDVNNQPSGCANYAPTAKGGWWYGCSRLPMNLNGVGSNGFFMDVLFVTLKFGLSVARIASV